LVGVAKQSNKGVEHDDAEHEEVDYEEELLAQGARDWQ
jgi:hypothetical protein